MKERKSAIERIRREAQRFLRRAPPVLGKWKTKRRWLDLLSEVVQRPVKDISGTLYVVGDSHVNFFGGEEHMRRIELFDGLYSSLNLIPFIKTFNIGAATAHKLPDRNSKVQATQKTEELIAHGLMHPRSTVLLSFGEIDCRVHIIRQAEKRQQSVEELIDETVENYMSYAEWLHEKGFRIACWGAIASKRDAVPVKPEFPGYGSEIERNGATLLFNRKLEEACRERGFLFCSIFDRMVDEDLRTRPEYISWDDVHLSQHAVSTAAEALVKSGILRLRGDSIEVVPA